LRDMEKPRNAANGVAGGRGQRESGWCWSLFMFVLGFVFVGVATAFSLVWIYTGGRLDQASVERALPVIRRDVDATMASVGKQAEALFSDASKALEPYLKEAGVRGRAAWEWTKEASMDASEAAHPYLRSAQEEIRRLYALAAQYAGESWAWLKPKAWAAWVAARPHFQRLGEVIIAWSASVWAWLEATLPIWIRWLSERANAFLDVTAQTLDGLING